MCRRSKRARNVRGFGNASVVQSSPTATFDKSSFLSTVCNKVSDACTVTFIDVQKRNVEAVVVMFRGDELEFISKSLISKPFLVHFVLKYCCTSDLCRATKFRNCYIILWRQTWSHFEVRSLSFQTIFRPLCPEILLHQ